MRIWQWCLALLLGCCCLVLTAGGVFAFMNKGKKPKSRPPPAAPEPMPVEQPMEVPMQSYEEMSAQVDQTVLGPGVQPLLAAAAPLVPLPTTSTLIPSYSVPAAAPTYQSYSTIAPAMYQQAAAPVMYQQAAAPAMYQQAAAPGSISYAMPTNYTGNTSYVTGPATSYPMAAPATMAAPYTVAPTSYVQMEASEAPVAPVQGVSVNDFQ